MPIPYLVFLTIILYVDIYEDSLNSTLKVNDFYDLFIESQSRSSDVAGISPPTIDCESTE